MLKHISGIFFLAMTLSLFSGEKMVNLLKNPGFELKSKDWVGAKILPGKGHNGSAAAFYSRENPKARVYTVRQKIQLEPNSTYEFGGFVKTDGPVKPGKRGGFIFIVTRYQPGTNKYVSSNGFYIDPDVPEWELYTGVFTTPKEKYDYSFMFYFESGATGKIYVDDLFLRKLKNQKMPDRFDPDNLVSNPHFDYGTTGYTGGAKVERKGGRGNTSALVFSRTEKNKSFYAVRQTHFLEPNTIYVFGGYAKGEGDLNKNINKSIMITIEPRGAKDRKFHGIVKAVSVGKDPKSGFHRMEKPLKTFPGQKGDFRYEITVYLPKGLCGKVFVDDLFLKKKEKGKSFPNGIISMVYPSGLRLPTKGVTADFVMSHAARNGSVFSWELRNTKGKVVRKGQTKNIGNKFQIRFGKVPQGDYVLSFVCPPQWGKCAPIPLTVADPKKWPGTTCYLDAKGRAIVNGKPYMPLGFLIYYISRKDVEILSKSPFNTLMSYASSELDLSGKRPPRGVDRFKGIIETLDELNKNNIKLIFSIKDFYTFPTDGDMPKGVQTWNGIKGSENIAKTIIKRLKSHPAIMAWYICDEIQQQEADYIVERRRLVNKMDPQHITWAVHMKGQNYNFHIDWQDVFGCDPYPIRLVNSDNMKIVTEYMEGTISAYGTSRGLACWAVPQAFHNGIYYARGANKNKFRTFRYPTEHEMLSFTIQMAIHGVKGFLFFNYSDFFRGQDKDQFEKRWPQMLRVGYKLKSLEEFILSDRNAENLKLEKVTGKVYAKVLRNNAGKPAVLLAAEGPGEASAEFTFPGKLSSECGNTVSLGGNRYRFRGKNIACDILR